MTAPSAIQSAEFHSPEYRTRCRANYRAIHSVAHLADIGTLKRYAKLDSWSLWSALVALSGVPLLGILRGLIFAVALSLVVVMRNLSVPTDSILDRVRGSEHFVDVSVTVKPNRFPDSLSSG
jgi:sulfate permease, SulP family